MSPRPAKKRQSRPTRRKISTRRNRTRSLELATDMLRWKCTPHDLVQGTEEHSPTEIIGQDRALRALRLGLEMKQYGYNIFVNGVSGTGRTTAIKLLLKEFEQHEAALEDKCYVHNFHDPDSPLLIRLPAGKGSEFRNDMATFVNELLTAVPAVFESRRYQEERKRMLEHFQDRQRSVLKDFERRVRERGFEVVQVQAGPGVRPEIAPVVDGTPTNMEQLQAKVDKGELTEKDVTELATQQSELEGQMELVMREMRTIERKAKKSLDQLNHKTVVPLVEELMDELRKTYTTDRLIAYLDNVRSDVLSNISRFQQKEEQQPTMLGLQMVREEDDFVEYKVNVVVDNSAVKGLPVIIETNPRYKNLFGTIERVIDRQGIWRTDFTQIKAGSLLKADGGFLVLNAIDVLIEPWVWTTLKRVLRNRQTEIQPPESGLFGANSGLKPEPISLNVKVIMVGDAYIHHLLYEYDDDFKKVFKIRADFDVEMPNDRSSVSSYISFVRSLCEAEELLSFDTGAMAEVLEFGARLAGDQRKLSTRFNIMADVLREANYWATKERAAEVTGMHVRKAISEKIERLNLVEQKIQEMILDGSLLIDTSGAVVGQVNGLSVYQMGEYAFGKPTRITVKTGMGQVGIINIEREADLSGPSHNKGVLILAGYLRFKYSRHKQLLLSASIAFEQSYSGVDGDSASSAEVYALLSSLSGLALRQDLAVTGSINQHGDIQPIGGVNNKIEGFFDTCTARGLTGTQGVIIPKQNSRDLMLRHDVVEAVEKDMFHIYAISTIDEGIELLIGKPAGEANASGKFPSGTIHGAVDKTLTEYARQKTTQVQQKSLVKKKR
jgi:predicted ATP-dependent protease